MTETTTTTLDNKKRSRAEFEKIMPDNNNTEQLLLSLSENEDSDAETLDDLYSSDEEGEWDEYQCLEGPNYLQAGKYYVGDMVYLSGWNPDFEDQTFDYEDVHDNFQKGRALVKCVSSSNCKFIVASVTPKYKNPADYKNWTPEENPYSVISGKKEFKLGTISEEIVIIRQHDLAEITPKIMKNCVLLDFPENFTFSHTIIEQRPSYKIGPYLVVPRSTDFYK